MKKLNGVLMGLALLGLLVAPSIASAQCQPAACIGLGDIDQDGFLTSLDLGGMIDFLFAGGTEPIEHVTDIDGDGFTTSLDLGTFIDVLFAGGSANFPERDYVLVGRSGPGTTRLLCDDSVNYFIGDPDLGGTYNVGTDSTELGVPNMCAKTDTLIIPPGTRFKGSDNTDNPAAFIVRRTGYVQAVGTEDAPIVFGSRFEPGARNRGDWGGMVINGCACNNNEPGGYIVETEGDGGIGGGYADDDNSGCYMYMRVEFAGIEFSADNELNGITLTSVGNGTLMRYIQINQNFDDGIEWFGGKCDMKYSVVSGIGDDGFDSDFGAQWRGQYLIVVRDPGGVVSSNYNGFEWDNEPDAPYQDCPRMKPTVWNATLVGMGCEVDIDRHDGAHIRRGADANINNTVWTEFNAALEYDNNTAWDDVACDPGGADCNAEMTLVGNPDARIEINHSIWYEVFEISGNSTTTNELPYMPASVGGPHLTNVYPAEGCGNPALLIQPIIDGVTPLDFRPIAGDPNGVGINTAGAVPPVDGFFIAAGAGHKGALVENDPDPWYEGWTDFSID